MSWSEGDLFERQLHLQRVDESQHTVLLIFLDMALELSLSSHSSCIVRPGDAEVEQIQLFRRQFNRETRDCGSGWA